MAVRVVVKLSKGAVSLLLIYIGIWQGFKPSEPAIPTLLHFLRGLPTTLAAIEVAWQNVGFVLLGLLILLWDTRLGRRIRSYVPFLSGRQPVATETSPQAGQEVPSSSEHQRQVQLAAIDAEDRTNPSPRVLITGVCFRVVINITSGYHYIEFHYVGVNATIFTLSLDPEVKGRAWCEEAELADSPEIVYPDATKYEVLRGCLFGFTLRQKLAEPMMAKLMYQAGGETRFTFDNVVIRFRLQEGIVRSFQLSIPKTLEIILPHDLSEESYRPEFRRLDFPK